MNRQTSACLSLSIILLSMAMSIKVLAHEAETTYTHLLGGDECDVRNSTNEYAAALRKVDGTIQNISDDLQATISCPIPITYSGTFGVAAFEGDIEIFFLNSQSTGEQKFRCNIFANDVFEESEVLRDWKSVDVLSGATGSIEFRYGVVVGGEIFGDITPRRPTITCGLPPKSTLLSILIEGHITDPI